MRSFTLLSLLLAVFVAVEVGADKKLFEKYGKMKIFESCYGKNLAKEYLMKMKMYAMECKMMPMQSYRPSGSSGGSFNTRITQSNSFGSSSSGSWGGSSSSSNIGSSWGGSSNNNNRFQDSKVNLQGYDFSALIEAIRDQAGDNVNILPIPVVVSGDQPSRISGRFRRQTREKFYTAEMVRKLATKMKAKMSNMTCVMQKFGYMDDNLELNYNNMINEIEGLSIDSRLRQDLVESVRDCSAMAQCVPANQKDMPFPPAMKRFMVFHKCSEKMKYMACMKKDLRQKRDQFDLSGMDDLMQGADDDEKMLAIIWAKTALGGDDFGL